VNSVTTSPWPASVIFHATLSMGVASHTWGQFCRSAGLDTLGNLPYFLVCLDIRRFHLIHIISFYFPCTLFIWPIIAWMTWNSS